MMNQCFKVGTHGMRPSILLRGRKKLKVRDRALIFILSLLFLSYYAYSAAAQDYLFSVPRLVLDVQIQQEGSAVLNYDIEFQNSSSGRPIDIVDIGLPHEEYEISTMQAAIDEVNFTDIRRSEYIHPGVEVHLNEKTIQPGQSANFKFSAVISNLVFQDTTRKDYASFQIVPTWFGEKYVVGTSTILIRIHLPEGISEEEVLYQHAPFTGKEVQENHVVVSWETEQRLTAPYRVGVSFPKRVMSKIVTMTISQLLLRWYLQNTTVGQRTFNVILSFIALGFIFLRFTGGTGGCLLLILLGAFGILHANFPLMQILVWPFLLLLGVTVETVRHRRKSAYLPAIASVEGGGIKRGLTAPEAAILLELPVNKVATLVLFGMLKKGLIRQNQDPISFSVVQPDPPSEAIIQPYEKLVLGALKDKDKVPIKEVDLTEALNHLIESTAGKMKGFDLEETREYYKQIIARAWKEAKSIGDIETWQKKMDEKIDWMILDPDFNDRFSPYNDRYTPRPYRFPSTTGGGTAGKTSAPAGGGGTGFSDVAASVSGWLQNTSQSVATKIEGKGGGILDLGGVDKAFAKAMKSSGSGRSGGGGSCACACAGCACACACAGGGR